MTCRGTLHLPRVRSAWPGHRRSRSCGGPSETPEGQCNDRGGCREGTGARSPPWASGAPSLGGGRHCGPFFSATLEWSSPWENPESETECCPCAAEVGRCSPARGRPGWPSTLTLVLVGGGEEGRKGTPRTGVGAVVALAWGSLGARAPAQFPSKIKVVAEGPPHLRQSGTHVPTSDT